MRRKKRKRDDYYSCLKERLKEYINDETRDSAYYYALASKAPTPFARNIILGFSQDEWRHAESFRIVYKEITGKDYTPQPIEPIIIEDYEEALKMRVLAETKDYKKYGDEYLIAPTKYLENLFFETRTIEAQHAMKIPILFEKERENLNQNDLCTQYSIRPNQYYQNKW